MLRMQIDENVNSITSEINSVTIANKSSSAYILRFGVLIVMTMTTAVQCDVTPFIMVLMYSENLRWKVFREICTYL